MSGTLITGFGQTPLALQANRGLFSLMGSNPIFSSTSVTGFYPVGHWVTSPLALTIVAPQASATSTNRYTKHYPGIPFTVPVIAHGGAWPYVYSISGQPTGMTIGTIYGSSNYGNIVWSSPVAGSYTITLTVTDQANTSTSVTWTLVVGTSNWIFVDATNGQPFGTNTGTQASPFKTMADWYFAGTTGSASRFDSTYTNYGVIYMAGTYLMDVCWVDTNPNGQVEMSNKPKVHLAYPGATVNWDPHNAGSAATFSFGSVANVFVGGINFLDVAGLGLSGMNNSIRISSGATDCGMFQCNWSTPSNAAVTGSNPGFFMCDDNHPSLGQRIFMSQCTFQGANGYDLFLGYYSQKVCLLDNTINGINDGVGFYPKLGTNDTWTIRNNVGLANNGAGNASGSLVRLDNYNQSTNIDICWNNYLSTEPGIYYGPDGGGTGINNIASYRNTWQIFGHIVNGTAATIPVTNLTVTNDVNQFTNSSANAHGYQLQGAGASLSGTFSGEECVGLNGGFVNSSGQLQGASLTYFGIRGSQVG